MNEELKIIISAETEKAQKNIRDAKKEIDKLGDDGKKSSGKFNQAMKEAGDASNKMAQVVKNAMKVTAVAIAAAGASLVAITEGTREYRTEQAKLQTAFESAGGSAETAKTAYNDLYRVLGDTGQATEAAAHLAKLTTNEKELAEWTNVCQGVYATFGDSLPIESLTEAANETAKVGTVTGSLADALNWAGVSEDDFNAKLEACNSEAEREKLIRTTLNGLYDKSAKNYEKNAGDILAANEAQAKLTESSAKLGKAMEPVITAFKTFLAECLEKITPYIQAFIDEYGPALEEALSFIGELIGNVISWIVDNWDVISVVATVVGAIAAAIVLVNTALNIYNGIMAITNAIMAASPITWIIAAITALIAIIILCIVYWEEIGAAAAAAWEWIKGVWEAVANWFNDNVIQPVVGFFKGLWESVSGFFKSLWDGIVGIFKGAGEWFNNTVIKPITNFFKNTWDGLKNGAKNAWEGIKNTFSGLANFFGNIFRNAWEGVKKVFSTGGKIFDGIKEGIVTAFKTVVNAIITGINKVVGLPFKGLNGILDSIQGIKVAGIRPFKWLDWRAPVPEIPLLAQGGVVDTATTAVIGEAGAEAVVPLENNLGWLDKLAGMLNERMGGTTGPIVLQVDGKTFAQVTCGEINKLTRQTGSLPLVVL